MTRGPAKPIRAFGSPIFRSPSIAKLAVTPPVVGSVRIRDERQAGAVQPGERGGDFGHLHERKRAFHHARAARAGDDDERLAAIKRHFNGARDLFPRDDTHAAADKCVLHGGHHHSKAIEVPCRDDDRIL